jgi:hypothetical protein
MEAPDFQFVYNDCDTLANELAEWYAYSEEPEFPLNSAAFRKHFEQIRKQYWPENDMFLWKTKWFEFSKTVTNYGHL